MSKPKVSGGVWFGGGGERGVLWKASLLLDWIHDILLSKFISFFF